MEERKGKEEEKEGYRDFRVGHENKERQDKNTEAEKLCSLKEERGGKW